MPSSATLIKRLLLGRPFRTERLRETLLSKRLALPIFASDALSSVAYAPAEILATVSVAGLAIYHLSPWVGAAVVVVLLTVVTSYRQNVQAYPSGGGNYEVVTTNLGQRYGLVVASSLLVDYVLTVAVSVAAGVENLGSLMPWLAERPAVIAVAVVVLLAAMNLRGVRESGIAFAIPTYGFMIAVLGMIGYGLVRIFLLGDQVRTESASFKLAAEGSFTGVALVFLLLRAFSAGSAALTGVEAISNGVPAFRKPKGRNAATTLLLLGVVASTMMGGILLLASKTGLRYVEDPTRQLVGAGEGYQQKTVMAQLAEAVFSGFPLAYYLVVITTALILVLAANTAFNGFPVLGSILAQDRYLPRQLHTRGDRLAFSNGILFLAVSAGVLLVVFDASPSALIHLYIVGVFTSFTLSQLGMVRHWQRLLFMERDQVLRRSMRRRQAINAVGLSMTGSVLVVVLITKFTQGAWIALVLMAMVYLVMLGIRRHYDRVSAELIPPEQRGLLPSRNHTIVLVSTLHKPALRALAYARATRPDTLSAVTVSVDEAATARLQREWAQREIPIPLTVIDSPYREITHPVVSYVKDIRRESPRDVVTVFVPEYVVGHWWENLLHNQSALRLKSRLRFEPGVMVTSVPYQLSSSAQLADRVDNKERRSRPGDVRRGLREPTDLRS
ncbi:MAG: DNA-binding protein [Acidimicrobiales bacterium]|nr:MAG: DNA-binding protein [Acidimicrobiales bacterium]